MAGASLQLISVFQESPPPAPQQLPVATAGAPATAATAANMIEQNPAARAATNAATNNEGPQTPQQQLQQLDRALQQLGINPESVSLFNRMAMLLYANDPAALEAFVQQLQQQVTQQTGQPAAAGATANNPGPAGAAQQETQNAPAANPTIPALSSSNQDTGTNQALGKGSNQTSGNGSTATGNSVFAQFEELQVAFATAGQDQTQDQTPAQGSPLLPQGQALSVTA